jgi:membrane associated rhomboid family serine protease
MPFPNALAITCLLLSLSLALGLGVVEIVGTRAKLRFPCATLATFLAVAAMLPLVAAAPGLLPRLERNSALLQRGELWRAATALFVNDAPLSGIVFNLVILLVIGTVAELRLGTRGWLAVYLGAGVLTEFLALAWQPQGGGNSIAVFGLAGALAILPQSRSSPIGSIFLIVAVAAGAGLLISRDIHGIGFLMGALIATVLANNSKLGLSVRECA